MLRRLIEAQGFFVCPGVTNPFVARMAERAGFGAVYATGAGIANFEFGVPDIGLIGMTEQLEVTRRIIRAVNVPVIADIDTGYGGISNVVRTMTEFEASGVAAVQIEDQVNPKRCGHFAGKSVVCVREMVERLLAVKEARKDPEVLIIGRTDSRATEGLGAAIHRGHHYVAAGADVIFVEAPQSLEELGAIPREFDVPTLANMVEGGKTPVVPAEELAAMGYAIALFANAVGRTAAAAAGRALELLHRSGSTAGLESEMLSWDERQALAGLPDFANREDRIVTEASVIAAEAKKA